MNYIDNTHGTRIAYLIHLNMVPLYNNSSPAWQRKPHNELQFTCIELRGKVQEIVKFMENHSLLIATLQEIKLTSRSNISSPNYSIVSSDRERLGITNLENVEFPTKKLYSKTLSIKQRRYISCRYNKQVLKCIHKQDRITVNPFAIEVCAEKKAITIVKCTRSKTLDTANDGTISKVLNEHHLLFSTGKSTPLLLFLSKNTQCIT